MLKTRELVSGTVGFELGISVGLLAEVGELSKEVICTKNRASENQLKGKG
jgi:hypothetical protein